MEMNIGGKGKERNFVNYSNYYYNSFNYFSKYFNKNTYDKWISFNGKIYTRIYRIKKRSWNQKSYKFKNSEFQTQIKVFIK